MVIARRPLNDIKLLSENLSPAQLEGTALAVTALWLLLGVCYTFVGEEDPQSQERMLCDRLLYSLDIGLM